MGERGFLLIPVLIITSNNGLHLSLLQTSTGRPLETLPLKNPPITRRTITNRKFLKEAMGRNKMKETTAPIGTQDRGEAQQGSTTRRKVGGTPTRAYGGDSRLRDDR